MEALVALLPPDEHSPQHMVKLLANPFLRWPSTEPPSFLLLWIDFYFIDQVVVVVVR